MIAEALGDVIGNTLLDIGGGSGVVGEDNWRKAGIGSITVIDAWDYRPTPRGVTFIVMDALDAITSFGYDSFDIIQCCECIEHLEKSSGHKLLEDMKRMARRAVILTCPNGYQEQSPEHFPDEPWANNPYQKHVCGWSADEFHSHGFAVKGNPELEPGCQLVAYWIPR
jgi:ubiquinone/menaquinone biosynthesis C-methylase UbiE